jgi:polar amino acid transport system substrate-binding protein
LAGQLPADIESLVIEDYEDAVTMLLSGQAAALVLPITAFRRLSLAHPEAQLHLLRTLTEVPYATALPLGEPDLQQFLNTWVFMREDDGTLAALHEAFLEQPRPVVPRL